MYRFDSWVQARWSPYKLKVEPIWIEWCGPIAWNTVQTVLPSSACWTSVETTGYGRLIFYFVKIKTWHIIRLSVCLVYPNQENQYFELSLIVIFRIKQSINLSFSLFSFPDIYWKHGPKYSCWEPTVGTSVRPVRPPVSLDLALGPVHADGSCRLWFLALNLWIKYVGGWRFVRGNWLLVFETRLPGWKQMYWWKFMCFLAVKDLLLAKFI